MDDAHALPNDLVKCHQLLLAAFREASELERVLDETAASYESLQATHQAALEELSALKRWIYGRRTEKIVEGDGQQHLFDLEPCSTAATPLEPRQELSRPPTARRRRRELDLDQLPHFRHEHDLNEAEKQCSGCGRAKDRIGQDESRILEYVPAKLEVHVYIRPKYACRYCKDGVMSPPPPVRPIARGIAGSGLIAQILVGKFGDHLPLYRQEDFFTRHGLHIPRSTLCGWVQAAAELLRPLYQRQKELVLQSPVLWTDDTPVTVLTGGKDGSRQGRFWTYIGEQHPYSVYDFTESRARDGPANFLAGFAGYLQADAYAGYDQIYLGSNNLIHEVACWAHARRKFFDARSSSPRDAHQILEWIRQLYGIEDQARELSTDGRREVRAREAEPVLDRIGTRIAELEKRALPKSALAKAVWYVSNQWQALRRYTEDGRLTIDNNVSERTLRHQAIGRKNWMFLGSGPAGPRAAVLFTILAGAKRHRIEPWAYLRELLLRLHDDDPRLDEMLPDRWACQHPESVLTYRLEESRRQAAARKNRRPRQNARPR
jgi:transposase